MYEKNVMILYLIKIRNRIYSNHEGTKQACTSLVINSYKQVDIIAAFNAIISADGDFK
jgi:hypothetical protein